MTQHMSKLQWLEAIPVVERREALEELVVNEFKATLFMAPEEELPQDESYFDLGFTSLRISEIKDRLESAFGREISTNLLFNSPTIEQLLAHLTRDVLTELFPHGTTTTSNGGTDSGADPQMWDELMGDLY